MFLNPAVIDVRLLTYSSKLSHLHFSADKGEVEEYDLAGLDETWQESDPEIKTDSDEDGDSDVIPQLDGSVDEKPQGKLYNGRQLYILYCKQELFLKSAVAQ